MWRVRKVVNNKSVVLELSGRLEGDHLAELKGALTAAATEKTLVLDLQGLRLVDGDVVQFLASCQATGAKLLNCPTYVREWMARERETRSEANIDGTL